MLSKEDRESIVEEIKGLISIHNETVGKEMIESFAKKLEKYIENESDRILAGDLTPKNPNLTHDLNAVTEQIQTFSQIVESVVEQISAIQVEHEALSESQEIYNGLEQSYNEMKLKIIDNKSLKEKIVNLQKSIEDEKQKQQIESEEKEKLQKEIESINSELKLRLEESQKSKAEVDILKQRTEK